MTYDFRADQVRTNKIIASGSTGTNAKILIYPIDADKLSSPNQGNIDQTIFNSGSIGSDLFVFISGSVNSKGVPNSHGTTGFGGDVVVSGSLSAKTGLTASISVTNGGLPFITGSGITTNYNSQGQWELLGGLPTATSGGQLLSSDGPGNSYSAIDTVVAVANIPGLMGEINSFHLLESNGNFQDRGSSPQTITKVGNLRYGRLGPKTLVPSVWMASSNPSKLSFPVNPGYNQPFTIACNFISNNETFGGGKLFYVYAGGGFGGVWVVATSTTIQLCIQNGGTWAVTSGQEIPIDWSKPHRLLVSWEYATGYLAVDGIVVDTVAGYSAVTPAVAYVFNNVNGLAASDCSFWHSVLSADSIKQDYENNALAFIPTSAVFGSTVPLQNGTASAGSSSFYSRLDHVHPSTMPTSTQDGQSVISSGSSYILQDITVGSVVSNPFSIAGGWSIVAPTSVNAGASVASFVAGGIGRITMDTTGAVHDLEGPRIERAISWDADSFYKFVVRIASVIVTTGNVYGGIYFRNGSGTFAFLMAEMNGGALYSITSGWSVGGGTAGQVNTDGTTKLVLRSRATNDYRFGCVTNGVPHRETTSGVSFTPTHFGIVGAADGAWSGSIDFDLPRLEALL